MDIEKIRFETIAYIDNSTKTVTDILVSESRMDSSNTEENIRHNMRINSEAAIADVLAAKELQEIQELRDCWSFMIGQLVQGGGING